MDAQAARTIIAQDALRSRPGIEAGYLTRDDIARRHMHFGLSFRQARDAVDHALDGGTASGATIGDRAKEPSHHSQQAISTTASRLAVLLPVEKASLDGALVQTVDARRLHAWLDVGRDFPTWMRDRIATYGLEAGVDYVVAEDLRSPISGSSKARPQRVKDYHLTLDAAKQLSMVDGGPRGAEVRSYFLACERTARAALSNPSSTGITPAVIGGIAKGVVGKLLAPTEERVAAIAECVAVLPELVAMVADLAANRDLHPPRARFWGPRPGGFASSRDVVLAEGGDPMDLRRLSAIVSAALRQATHRASAESMRCPVDGRHTFAPGIIADWLDGGGRSRIAPRAEISSQAKRD